MTEVEILMECRAAALEELALARQMERLAEFGGPKGLTGQGFDVAGNRKTNNTQAARLQQFEGLLKRLEQTREENMLIIQRAEDVIETIKDRNERVIIRYYYVEGESDYWIAKQVDRSDEWVRMKRNAVVETLKNKRKKYNRVGKI